VKTFRNIIATWNCNAPERIVLAAHYDSKYFAVGALLPARPPARPPACSRLSTHRNHHLLFPASLPAILLARPTRQRLAPCSSTSCERSTATSLVPPQPTVRNGLPLLSALSSTHSLLLAAGICKNQLASRWCSLMERRPSSIGHPLTPSMALAIWHKNGPTRANCPPYVRFSVFSLCSHQMGL